MPKVAVSFDNQNNENWEIDIEQTGEPQLTISKDAETLQIKFASNYEYKMYSEGHKKRIAADENGRRVYLTSLSR